MKDLAYTMSSKFSLKNTGVRRIMEELNELKKNPSDQYHAVPLEDNIFDWHFTLRGPKDTDFEGGFYHGRILLPSGYPFKPPNIYFFNENGRFETKKKICLSFSAYHPEEWQPAWGVRTILEALISFMPSKSEGAIGGLNWTTDERKKCVKKSWTYSCQHCGLIKDLIPPEKERDNVSSKKKPPSVYAEAISQMHFHTPGGGSSGGDKANTAKSITEKEKKTKVTGFETGKNSATDVHKTAREADKVSNVQRDGDVRTKGAAAKDKKETTSKQNKQRTASSNIRTEQFGDRTMMLMCKIIELVFTILILRKFSMLLVL